MDQTQSPFSFSRQPDGFGCELLDSICRNGGVWHLLAGRILLPRVLGFCQGVTRALMMLDQAVTDQARAGRRLVLLGQIIHNPWVNEYFARRGVRILEPDELTMLETHVGPADVAVIPAFGISPAIDRRLRDIGCQTVDTTCGDVRRLWRWAEHAVVEGFGVLIYGRATHDETAVTKSRLAEGGGKYLVVGSLKQAKLFAEMVEDPAKAKGFSEIFDKQATNAGDIAPFLKLAQVSQTTMLYDETIRLRKILKDAFGRRFGQDNLSDQSLAFQPTVCRATQDRQSAAVELCSQGCDLIIVVGGFGSSNTRHLYELACSYCPAYFIEDASSLRSDSELLGFDEQTQRAKTFPGWLTKARPATIGLLAGASCPQVVIGQVLQRLADLLA